MRTLALLFVVGATASAASAFDPTPAVQGFTGGSSFGSYYGSLAGDVVGFRFTSDIDQFVTALGVLDSIDGVVDIEHQVGLWRNSDQALLASASVGPDGDVIGGWYYDSIDPVALVAGEQYTLGALYFGDGPDGYFSSPDTIDLFNISNTNGVYPAVEELGFVYPELDSSNLARLGPNMILEPIPAPSSLALLGLGGLALRRRR
jgi:hypothetical protein